MCKKSKTNTVIPAKAGIWLPFIGILLGFIASPAHAQDNGVTVLELYTSQGCSSCPPADKLVQSLAKQPGIIALACHVTYFDQGEWSDTLALRPCSMRQLGYKNAGIAGKIFTPMIVLNGRDYAVGNHENEVREKLRGTASIPAIALKRDGAYLNIDVPAMKLEKPAALWIFAYDDLNTVAIQRGENKGSTIDYANAVRRISQLMDWDGRPLKMALPLGTVIADGFVVLAQYTDDTDIIAAGKTP